MFGIFKEVKEVWREMHQLQKKMHQLRKEVDQLGEGMEILMLESIQGDLEKLKVQLDSDTSKNKKGTTDVEISKRTGKPKRKYVRKQK